MHHPGPPRFVAIGDEVELAPRDPDPAATYAWRVTDAPVESTATLGEDPVEHFVPDAPGRYHIELSAPDGTHGLTIRAFPGELGTTASTGVSGRSGGQSTTDSSKSDESVSGDHSESAREESTATGSGGRPRVSLSATTTEEAVVVRATPQAHPDGSETAADLDVEFLLDDRDALALSDVSIDGRELSIPLEQVPDRARVHAVSVGHHGYSVPDAIEITRDGSGVEAIQTTRPYDPPKWAKDATIYEIYLRTFPGQEANAGQEASEASETSDENADRTVFDSIIDRLDYIETLGIDALWLTPVLENDHAPHGYNVTDFFAIAEDLGTRADYERLIEEAHDRGIKVLFDLVCNHSARDHPYYQAAVSNPDSEYHDWYEWRGPGEPETYFEWEYIANFDFDHLPVRRHLLDAVEKWAPLVDGFRCDMAWAVPNGFWREIHDYVKDRNSEFLLLDETIPYIPDFQAGLFDIHFDSTTYAALRRVGRGDDSAEAVLGAIDERTRIGFPDHAGFMLYAENHDETRYIVECGRPAAKAAMGALFTLPGTPMLYAGQEFGQRGKRDPLAWQHTDDKLREYAERLASTRTQQPSLAADADLQRVNYEVVEGEAERVVAYARVADHDDGGQTNAAEAAIVVLNFGADPATVDVEGATGDIDLITGEIAATTDGVQVADVVVLSVDPETVTE